MKILQVLKSEPDEIIETLMGSSSEDCEVQQFEMYNADVDYDKFIDLVFKHDKVICWW